MRTMLKMMPGPPASNAIARYISYMGPHCPHSYSSVQALMYGAAIDLSAECLASTCRVFAQYLPVLGPLISYIHYIDYGFNYPINESILTLIIVIYHDHALKPEPSIGR